MGGNDGFTQFDTSSIVTTASEKTWSIRGTAFRRRDIILGAIAILALILVIVFAIVLAVEVSNNSDDNDNTSGAGDHSKSSQISGRNMCTSLQCLQTASISKQYMDKTVDPCDDFYAYACGHYAEANPRSASMRDVTQFLKVRSLNEDKVISELFSPVKDSDAAYERKLKMYLSACRNHLQKMELRGTPFLEHVVKEMPGWYIFGEFNVTEFDLEESLRLVHADFLTPVFFDLSLSVNTEDWTKRIVQISSGGTILPFVFFDTRITEFTQMRRDYLRYMYDLVYLIVVDKGTHFDDNKVHTFVADSFEVEQTLAMFAMSMKRNSDPHSEEKTVTLEQLTKDLNNTFDVTKHMKSFFREHSDGITSQTKVALLYEDVFVHLGSVLSAYLATDEGKRKLHNYMMWQLLSQYAHELSWNYIYAKRKLDQDIFDYSDTSDGDNLCFQALSVEMRDAMSAVFVKNFINNDNKIHGVHLMETVRDELLEAVDQFDWMVREDRKLAKTKILNSMYKVGYPDYMQDVNVMDGLYEGATMSPDNHMLNVLNMHHLTRKRLGKALFDPNYHYQWRYYIWSPTVLYYNPWHEMTVTYAFLEKPLFFANGPSYWNYGGLASLMAEHLLHGIDEFGRQYRLDKTNLGVWWHNETDESYRALEACAASATEGMTFGPYKTSQGEAFTMNHTERATAIRNHVPLQLSRATGIRLAYKSYMKDLSTEPLPPVMDGQTPARLFFLSHAQMFCENKPPGLSAMQLMQLTQNYTQQFPRRERVNAALKLVPEFYQAFKCPANTKARACPGLFP